MRERHDREVEEHRAYQKALIDEGWNAGITAGAQWDVWRDQAHAAADRLLAAPLSAESTASAETPCTLSELSTSPAATAEPAAPKPLWDRSARMAARRGLSPSR